MLPPLSAVNDILDDAADAAEVSAGGRHGAPGYTLIVQVAGVAGAVVASEQQEVPAIARGGAVGGEPVAVIVSPEQPAVTAVAAYERAGGC